MNLKFDKNGNVSNDITLSLAEFEKQFGYNPIRKKLIQNLFAIAKIFAGLNCEAMYVDGSFITTKKLPGDIDVCFDITDVDYVPARQKHPELFTNEGQINIKKLLNLDMFLFGSYNDDILYVFSKDRQGNKKGIVKIFLKDLLKYDKERKTI